MKYKSYTIHDVYECSDMDGEPFIVKKENATREDLLLIDDEYITIYGIDKDGLEHAIMDFPEYNQHIAEYILSLLNKHPENVPEKIMIAYNTGVVEAIHNLRPKG